MGLNNDRRVSVVINGNGEGVWDKRSGGKTTSTEKKYYPGGGRGVAPVSLGGKQEHEAITLERGFDTGVSTNKVNQLRRLCGRQIPVRVTELYLDADGNKVGEGETYIGTLRDAWPSDADSENEDESMIGIVVTVTSIV